MNNDIGGIIWLVILSGIVFFTVTVILALKQRRKKSVTGKEELIGSSGTAKKKIDLENGMVFVEGELWEAKTEGEVIEQGEKIKVIDVDGLTLKVKKI